MELIRIGPKLWIVNNDRGEPIEMTDDDQEAAKIYFEIEGINRRNQPMKLGTQHKRLAGLKKANIVRQQRGDALASSFRLRRG